MFETDGDFEARVRESFARQGIMGTMGVRMRAVEAGAVTLEMPFHDGFTQQHGFLHAGAITTALDSAAGYAALSLMPEGAGVLTVELKTSLMRPARGEMFRFEGRVLKAGRSVMFAEAHCFGEAGEIAHLTATMMVIEGRDGVSG